MPELNLEQLKQLQEEYAKLKQLIESGANTSLIKDQLEGISSAFSKMKDSAMRGVAGVQQLTQSGEKLADAEISPTLSEIGDQFRKLRESTKYSNEEIGLFLGKMVMLSPLVTKRIPLPEAFQAMGKEAEQSSTKISKMLDTTLQLFSPDLAKSKIPGISEAVGLLAENAKRADFAKEYEQSLLMTAAATGQFSEVMRTLGADLEGLGLKADSFSSLITAIGNASGLSSGKVAEYANLIKGIPGALDNFGGQTALTVDNMHFLDAAIKVATGTGQEFSRVVEDMNFMFDNLGVVGKPALEIITQMQSVSDVAGLPLEKMRDFTREAAGAFKFLGDNAQGAIAIMAQLGPTLQKSGLGPAAINELVKGVTSGISQMSTAQKSFLSSQTGGAGGLQGAFQIDLMLRQGKLDEVFNKVEQNLRQQFGRPIVGLEEAASDAGAAAQFQKQIALLKSPAMGGIAKSDAEAMRILEALAAKEKGGVGTELKTPEQTFKEAISTGDKLQERQNSLLLQANNWAERQAQIQSVIAYNTSRQFGSDGPFSDYLRELKSQASMVARDLQPMTGEGSAGGQSVDDRLKEAYSQGLESLGGIKDKVTSLVESQAKDIVKATSINVDLMMQDQLSKPSMEMPISEQPMPSKFAARSLAEAEMAGEENVKATSSVNNSQSIPVDVSVTTVCSICQSRTATKAAQTAVAHYHNATEQSYRHNQQPVF